MVKIKSEYTSQTDKYNSISEARDSVCRNYLSEIELANAINNLESVFSNVSFFPISSIGHVESQGLPFEPFGVVDPIDWIATKCHSGIKQMTSKTKEEEQ